MLYANTDTAPKYVPWHMVGEKVAVVEKLHTASVCERENLDGQTDKHKIEIICSVKDSWLSHIFVCSRCPE